MPRQPATVDYTAPETYARLRQGVEQAVTLIPDAYRSPTFFEIERERVWSKSWVVVGYASEIPNYGDVLVAEVAVIRVTDAGLASGTGICGDERRQRRLVVDRHRAEEDRIQQGEDGRVGADPKRQG